LINIPRTHDQVVEIEKRINEDMNNLLRYAKEWHQPVNPKKTEVIVFHRGVRCPKIKIFYNGIQLVQQKVFKYLGFHLDSRLSFRNMIDAQLVKMRRAYQILKYIHRQFPMFFSLKSRFFNTYIWPHLYMLSTIYCLLSNTNKNRISAFYRRCLRLTFCLFQCPTISLHSHFALPTLEQRFRKSLKKRMLSIQRHEPDFLDCVLANKHVFNVISRHYREKKFLRAMPQGRPSKRTISFLDADCETFFHKLCKFVWNT
jgi:hypothetical protein